MPAPRPFSSSSAKVKPATLPPLLSEQAWTQQPPGASPDSGDGRDQGGHSPHLLGALQIWQETQAKQMVTGNGITG